MEELSTNSFCLCYVSSFTHLPPSLSTENAFTSQCPPPATLLPVIRAGNLAPQIANGFQKPDHLHKESTQNLAFKSTSLCWLTKVCLVKAVVFPLVMCGCESWTMKKAECWRTDGFKLWCWKRFLRVLWTGMVIKSVNPEINQPWMLEKTLMLGKIEGRGRRGWQKMR